MGDWIPPEAKKKKESAWVPPEANKPPTPEESIVPGKPSAPPVSTASPSTSVAGNGVAASGGVGRTIQPFKGLDTAAPRKPQMMPTTPDPNRGTREDGTPKGPGWLGSIPTADGREMTELSFDFDVDGKKIFAPLLVPTLDEDEVALLASGGDPTDAIYKKAQDFAIQRLDQGKSPFKEDPRSIVKKEKPEYGIKPMTEAQRAEKQRVIDAYRTDFTPGANQARSEAIEALRLDDDVQKRPYAYDPEHPEYAKYHGTEAYYDLMYGGLDEAGVQAKQKEVENEAALTKKEFDAFKQESNILDHLNSELLRMSVAGQNGTPEYQAVVDQYNSTLTGMKGKLPALQDMETSLNRESELLARKQFDIANGKGSWGGAIWNSVVDGIASMEREVAGSILPDVFTELEGWDADKTAMFGFEGAGGKDKFKRLVKEAIGADIKEGMDTAKSSGTTQQYMDKLKEENPILGPGILGLAQSAPAMATPFMAGILLQTMDSMEEEMKGEEWNDVSEWEKKGIAAIGGSIAMTLERIGFRNLSKSSPFIKTVMARVIAKTPSGATAGTIQRILDAETMSAAKNFTVKMVAAGLAEGETGAAQELADIGLKSIYNRQRGDELFKTPKTASAIAKQALIGGLQEMVGGWVMGTPGALSSAMGTKGAIKDMEAKQYVYMETLLLDPKFADSWLVQAKQKVKEGKMTQAELDKTKDDWDVARGVAQRIPEGMDPEKRKEAFDLILQREELNKKDKILTGTQRAAIDEKLAALVGGESDNRTDPTTAQEALAARDKAREAKPEQSVVSPEVRDEMVRARQALGVEFDPLDDLPNSVVVSFERVEDGLPVSVSAIEEASSWMYNKYKQVIAMRDDPARLLTLDQIDSYAKQLGDDIEVLENYKQKLRTDAEQGTTSPQAKELKGTTASVTGAKADGAEATGVAGSTAPVVKKAAFGESPDKGADASVWSSLSKGSVLTDSSDPNSHWVVVDDTTSNRSGDRVMSLAIVEKEADGTWTAGPPSIIVHVGADGSLRTDTSPRYSYTDANGNRNVAIMQPSDVSIPFGELIQEDPKTGEKFTPQWAKEMPGQTITPKSLTIDEAAITEVPEGTEPTTTTGSGEVGTTPVVDEQVSVSDIDPELDDILDVKRKDVLKDEGSAPPSTKPTKMTNERATALLKKVVPGIKFVKHSDQQSLAKAYAKGSGRNVPRTETATTKGFYDVAGKTAHTGPFASDTTLAHEVMHPLFRAALSENPERVKALYDELKNDPDFAPYVEHGNKPGYKAKGEAMVHEEAIVQFMAAVYEGKLDDKFKKDKNFLQKVRDFIKDIMTKMGLRKNEINFSNIEDLKQMAGLIQEAVRTGGVAVVGDVKSDVSAEVAMQEDADRLVDGWYSRLDDAVAAKGNTQSGADWMKWAEARAKEGMLSMEEVKWTGLEQFLEGKKKVTPQEVREFLKENRVKVEVKVLGLENEAASAAARDEAYNSINEAASRADYYEGSNEKKRLDEVLDAWYNNPTESNKSRLDEVVDDLNLRFVWDIQTGDPTKFSQYQLPGGTNYREVLVTLPPTGEDITKLNDISTRLYGVPYTDLMADTAEMAKKRIAVKREYTQVTGERGWKTEQRAMFRSSHFDEPNILVHLRLNDRTDADGKKVLFIEELQSDWGQKGKKEGFYSPLTKSEENELRSLRERTYASEKYPLSEAETKRANELIAREGGPQFKGPPSAPFVTDTNSWVELGLKQAIRMAVDGGYDRIAWTHGQVHTDRWGTERIEWAKQNDGSFLVNAKSQHGGNAGGVDLEGAANAQNLNQENSNTVSSREELEEAIRPSLTEGQDAKKLSEKLWTKMQADDSGMSMPRKEGFEGFYDKILPNVAKKVSKKLGGDGKVGEVEFTKGESRWVVTPPDSNIPYWQSTSKTEAEAHAKKTNGVVRRPSADLTQQSIEITDAMRDKAGLGVPLMARGTPQEIADAFKKKGYTDQKAREYMDNAGVDEQTIKDVMDAMKPVKEAPPERKEIPKGREERASAERIRNDDPELYKLLSAEDISYEKIPEKNKISLKTAEDMVRMIGPANALLAVEDFNNGMPEAVRTYMARMIPKVFEENGDMTSAVNAVNKMLELAAKDASGLQAFRGFANSKEAYIPSVVMVNTRKLIDDIIEKKMGDSKTGRYQRKKYEKTKRAIEDLNKEAVDEVLRGAEVGKRVNKVSAPQQETTAKQRVKKAFTGENNKVVTKKRKAEVLAQIRGRFGTGPDPLYIELAAFHIEAGARGFAAVAEEVTRELGRKAVPYFKEAYKKAFDYLKERGVDVGEPDTDATINEVIAKVNTEDLVERLKKALAKNDQKTSSEILTQLQEQSKGMDAWGAYRDYAVDRLERMANQEIAESRLRNDAMREFTDGLVRNMSAQMREEEKTKGVPKKEEAPKKSDIQVIGEAFRNFEKYKDVWSKTQNEFKARLRAAEARLEKADTPIAKEEAQQAIEKEQARLEKLDAYFGDLMLKPFSEVGLGRAVKAGLKDLNIKIDTIVRQHYTVAEGARRSLQEKLVQDAGLTEESAKTLADAVGREFDKLTLARREKIIEQYLGRHAVDRVKKERKKSTEADEINLLENTGALSNEDFLRAYAKSKGWPTLTNENVTELKRLSDRVQTAPEGRPRNEAIADLLTYQANLPGVSGWDLLSGIWYANMLAGFSTQGVNTLANFLRTTSEFATAAARSPKDSGHLIKSLAYGFMRSLPEFASTMRTGYSPIRGRIEAQGALERSKWGKVHKYIPRVMKAADVLAYEPLRELRAYQLAIRQAREEGAPTGKERQRALDILNRDNTSLKEAADQAKEEYDKEIASIGSSDKTKAEKNQAIKKANLDRRRRVYELVQEGRSQDVLERSARFALSGTYNSPPPGAIGSVARAINNVLRENPAARYAVPFVNVIANVLHDGMNYYGGIGIARAWRGGSISRGGVENKKLTQAERDDIGADYFVKGVMGLVATVAALLMSGDDDDDFEITANGYGNWADNAALRKKGWMPYSIRFPGSDTYISYQYTPLILTLGLVGHYRDAQKYRKEKIDDSFYTKMGVALSRNMSTAADMSFLATTANILTGITDDRKEDKAGDFISGLAKVAKRTIIPATYDEIAKNMEAAYDIPEKEVRGTLLGQFLKDIPYARDMYEDKYDAFGPIVPKGTPFRRFVSIKDEQDPVVNLMVEKNFPLRAPHPGTLTVISDDGENERVMTESERAMFYDRRAMIIREEVDASFNDLIEMDNKEFAKEMSRIQSYATAEAKAMIEY